MERNDENTINAHLEKALMDAADAADEAIDASVDEKDPVRRTNILTEGYRKALRGLLGEVQHEVDIPKVLEVLLRKDGPAFHTPNVIANDIVVGNPPFGDFAGFSLPGILPGGADGATPGPDPAAEVAQKTSTLGVLRDKFGLDLKRFATGKVVKLVGKRRTEGGLNDCIWELDVDKASSNVEARCDGTVVYRMQGLVGGCVVENMAVSALIRLLSERRRRHLCEKRARIRRAAAKEAGRE